MARNHKAPQYNVACAECMKIHPSSSITGLQREAEERIAKDSQNIDHERSFMNLTIHGMDVFGNPVVNHEKPEKSLEERIYGRINEVGAKVRFNKQETSVERGHNSKESVICEGIIFQVSHERSMELLAEDGMLNENGQIRKDRELPEDGKVYSLFMDTYRFACERFGEQNVVGAYIHLDEYTPHMHVFVVPVTMKESRYRGKVRTDETGNPIMKGVLDAKNIFSPVTIKQLWADYAKCIEKYGVSRAEGKVPKGMYAEVATMNAVVEQKRAEIDELSEMLLKGRGDYHEMERRISEMTSSLDSLESLICGSEKPDIESPAYSDPLHQEVIAVTLFPTLADWEIARRIDDKTLLLRNTRTFSSAQIRFDEEGLYVRRYEQTDEVGQDGRYLYRWTEEQRYDHYLKSHPREFENRGRAGVADIYVQHLLQFSLRLRSQHAFEDVMRAAASISPSVRYYLLTEYCRRNADNIPQSVLKQFDDLKKELKDVVRFPKETKGSQNQRQTR